MSYLRNVLRAAKNIRNPNEPNISGVPRQQVVPTIHMGEVTQVDVGRNVLGLKFNDPSDVELNTGVPWIRPFAQDDPPAIGDVVRYMMIGSQPMVLGRQVASDDTVSFP
jgi:hypothetical protein